MSHGAPHNRAAVASRPAAGAGAPANGGHGSHSHGRGPGGGGPTTKGLAVPLAAAAFVGLVALGVAVSAAPDPLEDGPALPPPPGSVPASWMRGENDPPYQPQNEFAFDLYRTILAGGERGGNVFLSPLSIRTAFSVLYEGAGGRTASQMADALRIDADADVRRGEVRRIADSLANRSDSSEIALANALWIDDGFSLYDSYLEAARGAYGAGVDTVDFADKAGASGRINEWASGSTNGLIKELIGEGDVNRLTVMVITNAIYFRGEWALPFPTHATQEGRFTREDGSAARADFMTVRGHFGHVAYDGYQVVRIPYKGDRLSMLVVLPDDARGLGSATDGLSADALASWLGGMEERDLEVTIPKFAIDDRHDLAQAMKSMGVVDAFDGHAADLQDIGFHKAGGNLYVGSAAHAAHISVDEVGTEAAAATGIVVNRISSPPSFVADRPFIFLVHDSGTGAILFMGSVADPSIG